MKLNASEHFSFTSNENCLPVVLRLQKADPLRCIGGAVAVDDASLTQFGLFILLMLRYVFVMNEQEHRADAVSAGMPKHARTERK